MGQDGYKHTVTSRDLDSTPLINTPGKCVYSKDFLLSLSTLEHCKIQPVGLDPFLLRDQSQLHVGTTSTSSGFGKHRSERISESFPDRQWQRPPTLVGRSFRQPDVKKTDLNNMFSRSAPTSGGFLHGAGVSRSKVVENRDGLLGSGDQMSQRDPLEFKERSKKNIEEHTATRPDVSKGTACFIPITFSQGFSPGSKRDDDMVAAVKGQYGERNREIYLATSENSGNQEIVPETLPYTDNNMHQEMQKEIMNRARLLELLRIVAHESRPKTPHDAVVDKIIQETKENKDEEGDKILLLEKLFGKDFINDLYTAAKQASNSNTNSALNEENKAFLDALHIAQVSKLLNDNKGVSSTYAPYIGDFTPVINSHEMNGQKIPILYPGMLSPGRLSPGLSSGQLSPKLPSGRLSPGLSPGDSPVSPFTLGARRGTGSFMPDYSKHQKGKKHISGGLPPTSPNTLPHKELPTSQDKNNNNKTSNKITSSPSSLTSPPWPPNFPFHLLQGNFIPSLGGSQPPWGMYGMPLALPLESSEQLGLNLMQQLQFQALSNKPLDGLLEAYQRLQAPEQEITGPTLMASLNQLHRTRSLDQLHRTKTFVG